MLHPLGMEKVIGVQMGESHIQDETRRLPTKMPCSFPHTEPTTSFLHARLGNSPILPGEARERPAHCRRVALTLTYSKRG